MSYCIYKFTYIITILGDLCIISSSPTELVAAAASLHWGLNYIVLFLLIYFFVRFSFNFLITLLMVLMIFFFSILKI